MSSQIASRLNSVKATISQIEAKHGRLPGSVHLLAVSKTKSIDDIQKAVDSGQQAFGESYVQEAIEKIVALKNKNLSWHFIGPIQKNKTRLIAENFDWVHSIDREIIAERLNDQRPSSLLPLQICIQVKLDNKESKSGVQADQVLNLAKLIQTLPHIHLRGLMTIPRATNDTIQQRQQFAHLRLLLENLNESGFKLDTLSMGMSGDLESAIAEGATIVRVGTAIFGEREK